MACACNDDALRDLTAGQGTSVEWTVDHTVSVDVRAKETSSLVLTTEEKLLKGDVKVAQGCDERLKITPSGLTAGSRQYATIGATSATRKQPLPQPIYVTANFTGTKVIANSNLLFKQLYVDNPSSCLWMRVMWTHSHNLPHISANPGFSMWIEIQERLYGTGDPLVDGTWSTVDRIYYINDSNVTSATPTARVISYPSVSYTASGSIGPSASFIVESRLRLVDVIGNATWSDVITGRSDAIAASTIL